MITLWDIIFVNKKLSLVLAITVVVMLVAISGGAMRELQRAQLHQKLVAHGMLTAATIVDKDKYTEKSKDGSSTVHRIRYEFKTGSSITNRTRKANRNVWESKHIGEKFTVRYLPENPESHVAEWEYLEPDIRLDPFLMAGIFGLVLYAIGYFAYRRLCTIKRILNYGIFDRATVTREIVHSGKKKAFLFI